MTVWHWHQQLDEACIVIGEMLPVGDIREAAFPKHQPLYLRTTTKEAWIYY